MSCTLRAIGLGLVSNLSPRQWFSNDVSEPLKVAITRNRTMALLRSLIHLVLVGVTLWLVILNWNTYYVGSFTLDQVYYQLGAKVLEIMIQASLAATLLAYLRYELVHGNRLPFGALFSGLQITQFSYLWSMEFWGSIGSRSHNIWKKVVMSILVLVTLS